MGRQWSLIDGQLIDTAMLAVDFRAILHRAIKSPVCDPRGPMPLVLTALCEYIRAVGAC